MVFGFQGVRKGVGRAVAGLPCLATVIHFVLWILILMGDERWVGGLSYGLPILLDSPGACRAGHRDPFELLLVGTS